MKFIALPVTLGDSFYYQRSGRSVLVDGGKSSSQKISKLLSDENIRDVDILICTHNDADHANGIIGFLQNCNLATKEVWLPGTWSHKLSELMQNPENCINKIMNESISPKQHHIKYSDEAINKLSNTDRDLEEKYLIENIDTELLFEAANKYSHAQLNLRSHSACNPLHCNMAFSRRILNAAVNICKIFSLASARSIKIRLFEHGDTNGSGGEPGFLIPVSSKEVYAKKSTSTDLVSSLYLTIINRHALVFLSPETKDYPAVLFSSDSNLEVFCQNYHAYKIIITAPHHGSKNNLNAATQIRKHFFTARRVLE